MKVNKKAKRTWKNDKKHSNSSSSDQESETSVNNDGEEEHDLSVYAGSSIQLMTEIFKIINDKKLKEMMPSILKPINIDDLKACLVEESMALSKKRIVSILNGNSYTSSSEDSDEEEANGPQVIDTISLDGISDNSDIFCFDDLPEAQPSTDKSDKKCKRKIKKTHKQKLLEIKKIPQSLRTVAEEKAMTALELLELQARARAIKSQLALETTSTMDLIDSEVKDEIKKEKRAVDAEATANEPVQAAPTKKVKLRRDHLRLDPNRTVAVKNRTKKSPPKIIIVPEKENDPKEEVIKSGMGERSASNESIILECPTLPCIVISSSEDEESRTILKKDIKEVLHEKPTILKEKVIVEKEPSSSEEGEISSEKEEVDKIVKEKSAVEEIVAKKVCTKKVEIKQKHKTGKNKKDSKLKQKGEKSKIIKDKQELPVIETKKVEVVVETTATPQTKKDKMVNKVKETGDKSKVIKDKQSAAAPQTEKSNKKVRVLEDIEVPPEIETNKLEMYVEARESSQEEAEGSQEEAEASQDEADVSQEETKDSQEDAEHLQVASEASQEERGLDTKNSEDDESNSVDKPIKSDDHDCIVIDSEPDFESEDEIEENNSGSNPRKVKVVEDEVSWKDRWLESRKVKNVLKTSKLCNNVKRKINSKKVITDVSNSSPEVEPAVNTDEKSYDEGSIDHFKTLIKDK